MHNTHTTIYSIKAEKHVQYKLSVKCTWEESRIKTQEVSRIENQGS